MPFGIRGAAAAAKLLLVGGLRRAVGYTRRARRDEVCSSQLPVLLFPVQQQDTRETVTTQSAFTASRLSKLRLQLFATDCPELSAKGFPRTICLTASSCVNSWVSQLWLA